MREQDLWVRRVSESVRAIGGIAATHELTATGHTPSGIFAAVRSGDVIRVRKGWYANTDLEPGVVRAWRVGGQLACVSAAVHHKLWVPELPEVLHVSVPPLAAQLRRSGNHRQRLAEVPDESIRIHWSGVRSGERLAVSVPDAIAQIFRCQHMDVGFVVLESALHQNRIDVFQYYELLDGIPTKARRLARLADASSESGAESLLKLMLLRRGIPFRQQVVIADIGRVDFLVGERLVIEVDSKEHHSDPYKDRRRDALLSVEGHRVLRFMYSQIVYERDQVEAAIFSALARSDHNRA
jgi:very-short-patch-repair endonuclease